MGCCFSSGTQVNPSSPCPSSCGSLPEIYEPVTMSQVLSPGRQSSSLSVGSSVLAMDTDNFLGSSVIAMDTDNFLSDRSIVLSQPSPVCYPPSPAPSLLRAADLAADELVLCCPDVPTVDEDQP